MVHFKFAPGAPALSDAWPGLDRSLMSANFRQAMRGSHPLSLVHQTLNIEIAKLLR